MTLKKDIHRMEGNFIDPPLHTKISLRRKLLGLLTMHLLFVLLVTSILKFTPLARFYINENEWILHLACLLLAAAHIVLLVKRNEYNFNVFLLSVHMLLQAFAMAIYVTYYDTLGILQGIFLTFCTLNLMFLHLLLFGKTCGLYTTLGCSCLILLTVALSFQIIFGSTSEELLTSIAFSLCLSFYYLYSVTITAHAVSYDKYCVAVIHVYVWPLISLMSRLESLVKG